MKYINKMSLEQNEELSKIMEGHENCIKSLVYEVSYNCGRLTGRDVCIVAIVASAIGAFAGSAITVYSRNHNKKNEDK